MLRNLLKKKSLLVLKTLKTATKSTLKCRLPLSLNLVTIHDLLSRELRTLSPSAGVQVRHAIGTKLNKVMEEVRTIFGVRKRSSIQ